jgi:tetratricopeptide (TPR) repeat protein
MNLTLAELSKLAIKAAFNQNWHEALEVNNQIIIQDENNLDAHLRLGLAYLQLQEYAKAKKAYSKVLDLDPINKIALDKMKLVREKKTEDFIVPDNDSLLKEPGNAIEASLEILTKGITADKFKFDENLLLKINGKTISVHRDDEKQSLINYLPDPIVKGILKAQSLNAHLTVKFIGGKDKKIKVLVNSNESVFPSEKQDIKPYIKGIGEAEMPEMTELVSDNEDDTKKIEVEDHQEESEQQVD